MSASEPSAPASETPPVEAQLPRTELVWATFGVALAAAAGGGLIFVLSDPELHLDPEGFAVFAPIYVAAQAVERLLEPLASRYGTAAAEKDKVKSAREDKLFAEKAATLSLAASVASDTRVKQPTDEAKSSLSEATEEEEKALHELRKKRSERVLIWFMVASVISSLIAGVLGLGILQAMSTEELDEYLGAIDVALTGLVIAAGTKPLHDLISRLEKAKQNADASTKPTAQLPGTPGASAPPPPAP